MLGSWTLWSQFTYDSLGGKWYTFEQRKQCIECLMNQPIIDSMLADCEAERIEMKEDFDGCIVTANEQRIEIGEKDEKISKQSMWIKILASVSGILLGLVLISYI